MSDTTLIDAETGAISPSAGVNTITVEYFDSPVGLRAVFSSDRDHLTVVRQCGEAWDPEGSGKESIELSKRNTSVVLAMPGVYGVSGVVAGTVTLLKVTE